MYKNNVLTYLYIYLIMYCLLDRDVHHVSTFDMPHAVCRYIDIDIHMIENSCVLNTHMDEKENLFVDICMHV